VNLSAARPEGQTLLNGSSMYPFAPEDLCILRKTLVVPKGKVAVGPHPQDDTIALVAAEYTMINVASAVASHLNSDPDFFRIPGSVDRTTLHYSTNKFAYVDPKSFGHKLCVTVNEPKDSFIEKLEQRADDIWYVVAHPDMLFLRRYLDFQTAKQHLNAGYKISVLSL
jgi:hypothetical protein